jgi:hypothetical protein
MPAWARAEPDTIKIVQLMQPQSAIGTPLLAGQDPLGVIVLGRGAERPQFGATDVQMIEELGRRLAVGLANTDTFAASTPSPKRCNAPFCRTPCPRSRDWTSRYATCPPPRGPPSAATGTTRSRSRVAGSGW